MERETHILGHVDGELVPVVEVVEELTEACAR